MNKIITYLFLLLITSTTYAQKATPDFTVTDIYGHTHTLYSDYLDQGKYVFIDFFRTGCYPCMEISPVLDTIYREFGCNYGDIVFLGIDGYSYDSYIFDFTNSYSMTFPAVSGNDGGGSKVFANYEVNYTPKKILINPGGKIIADYPSEYSAKYYRDTLLKENLNLRTCSGNDFWFFALNSQNDSIVGEINKEEQRINFVMPQGTDLTKLRAWYKAESNSSVKVNGTMQINGETINDFSQGTVDYHVTSEDGNTKIWTVSVGTTSLNDIMANTVKIYPNPTTELLHINLNTLFKTPFTADLYSINGKKVKSYLIKNALSEINIASLSEGIYFLKIQINNDVLYKKIIKKQ